MKKYNILNLIIFLAVSAPLIFIDQFTKNLALIKLKNGESFELIKNVFYFVYHENAGAAFGILQGKQIFFYIITIIILTFVLAYIYKTKFDKNNVLYFISILLIFSGAIGNFIDRLKNQYVIDFIYFKPINFPVFNVADSYITIGAFMMILIVLLGEKNENKKLKKENVENIQNSKQDQSISR